MCLSQQRDAEIHNTTSPSEWQPSNYGTVLVRLRQLLLNSSFQHDSHGGVMNAHCSHATGSVWMFQSSHLNCSLCLSVQVTGSGSHAVMLSLDEPLDLKVPRGRVSGWDRGARSPPTLTPSHAGQLRMADDGTAVIVPASPASPHTGNQISTTWHKQQCNCRNYNRGVYIHRCLAG